MLALSKTLNNHNAKMAQMIMIESSTERLKMASATEPLIPRSIKNRLGTMVNMEKYKADKAKK